MPLLSFAISLVLRGAYLTTHAFLPALSANRVASLAERSKSDVILGKMTERQRERSHTKPREERRFQLTGLRGPDRTRQGREA
jgi:hypothetical protein